MPRERQKDDLFGEVWTEKCHFRWPNDVQSESGSGTFDEQKCHSRRAKVALLLHLSAPPEAAKQATHTEPTR